MTSVYVPALRIPVTNEGLKVGISEPKNGSCHPGALTKLTLPPPKKIRQNPPFPPGFFLGMHGDITNLIDPTRM